MFRRLYSDDAFVFLAWLLVVVNAVIWQRWVQPLYLAIGIASNRVPLESAPADLLSDVIHSLHTNFVFYYSFFTALWCIKISFLLFFQRLGNHIRSQRILWWCVLAYTMAAYCVSLGLVSYVKCLLGSSLSQIGAVGLALPCALADQL